LGLAENRFEFVLQWLGGSGIEYSGRARRPRIAERARANALGASRQLAAGTNRRESLELVHWTAAGGRAPPEAWALVLTQPLRAERFDTCDSKA
jgi:hypothetical protein